MAPPPATLTHVPGALPRALAIVTAWSVTAALTAVAPMETTSGAIHATVPLLTPLRPSRMPTRWPPLDVRALTWPRTTRLDDAIESLRNSRLVDRCWLETLRQNPALRSSAVRITFAVTPAGRLADLDVANSPDVRFTNCIRASSDRLAPVAPGEALRAEMAVNLTADHERTDRTVSRGIVPPETQAPLACDEAAVVEARVRARPVLAGAACHDREAPALPERASGEALVARLGARELAALRELSGDAAQPPPPREGHPGRISASRVSPRRPE